jgi:CRP-like cAMP-binding protein
MVNITDSLIQTKLFSGISKKDVEALLPLLHIQFQQYEKGTILVNLDDIIDYVGIVLSGELNIYKEDVYGHLNLIRKAKAYKLFGIEVACTPTQVSPLVISCSADAEVLTFPFHLIGSPSVILDRFRCLLLKNILELVANANMRQLYKIDILSKKSLRDRIILYLSLQAKRKKTMDLTIPFNREEFAAYLCVDRSALSRELSRMQDEGLIRFEKNRFVILTDFTEH